MTLNEFQDLLDTYGANPDLWPDSVRETAINFLNSQDQAVLMHEEAMMLDGMLMGDQAPTPSPNAMTSLFEDVASHAQAEAHRNDDVIYANTAKPLTLRARLIDAIFKPAYVMSAASAAGIAIGFWDVWLAPVEEANLLTQLIFSSLPL